LLAQCAKRPGDTLFDALKTLKMARPAEATGKPASTPRPPRPPR
jgi:hypothetical protein